MKAYLATRIRVGGRRLWLLSNSINLPRDFVLRHIIAVGLFAVAARSVEVGRIVEQSVGLQKQSKT